MPFWSVSLSNQRLYVPSFDRWVAAQLFKLGVMGKKEKDFLKKEIQPGQTLIDVGANVGLVSALATELVGQNGTVLAIEPDAQLVSLMRQSFGERVTLIEAAVGAEMTKADYFRNHMNRGDSGLVKQGLASETMLVDVLTLDHIWEQSLGSKPVHWIKMDIQGYEVFALKGAKKLLTSSRPSLIVEVWPWGFKKAGTSTSELFALLQSHSYKLTAELYDGKELPDPEVLDRTWNSQLQYFNLVARPI